MFIPLSLALGILGLPGCMPDEEPFDRSAEPTSPSVQPPAPVTAPAPDPANETPAPTPPTSAAAGEHPLFPLAPGLFRIYEGDKEGQVRRDEVTVLRATETIDGVACTAVYQEVFLDEELAEVTTEWFALDDAGNVWKFGEASFERGDDGTFEPSDDSWRAGAAGARAWLFLGAEPKLDDVFFGDSGDDTDIFIVVSLGVVITVPAGVFEGVELEENPDDPDDSDIIIYAPDAGLVSEQSVDGRIELTHIEQR